MAKPGQSSGSGSSSPFGDGRGGSGMGKPAPRDFIVNPGGAQGGPGVGAGGAGTGPSQAVMKQQQGSAPDRDDASAAAGGLLPFDSLSKSQSANSVDHGVGTIGNSAKPYR